ncbi:hypothetical protein D3C84_582110 [compost metagenome]
MRNIATQLPFQRIHVKPVAGQDVVEGRTQAGEETDARRSQLLCAQLAPGLGQSMIGPGVLISHGQQMVGQGLIHVRGSLGSSVGETLQLHFL